MKTKVYVLFRDFETLDEDECWEQVLNKHRRSFVGVFGSEDAVMKEIEDRVMEDYYYACACFDERIEIDYKYGYDFDWKFDFEIVEQSDDRMVYNWCGDITTLYYEVHEIDIAPDPEKRTLKMGTARKLVDYCRRHKDDICKAIGGGWRNYENDIRKIPQISDSDGSVR